MLILKKEADLRKKWLMPSDSGGGAAGLLLERAAGPDAGEEACGTCADDDDVALEHGRLSQRYAG